MSRGTGDEASGKSLFGTGLGVCISVNFVIVV